MDRRLWLEIVEGRRRGLLARFLRLLLLLLSLPYRLAVRLRNAAYDGGLIRTGRLPVAVVSVGNICAGGTGKTPFVRLLAAALRERGRRVAVVSRGYGARGRGPAFPRLVSDGSDILLSAREAGDEPLMLARELPGVAVVVDPDRVRGGMLAAERFGAEAVILDDGFQHRRLDRDADIVLLDSRRPFGNGRLLPAGALREPAAALGRADIIVLTRCEERPVEALLGEIRRLNPNAPVFTARRRPLALRELAKARSCGLSLVEGRKVGAFSGIADPRDFESLLSAIGARIVWSRRFPDHHPFSAVEMGGIAGSCLRAGAGAIVTTTKDAARIPPAFSSPLPLYALEIEMEIGEGESELLQSLLNLLEVREK